MNNPHHRFQGIASTRRHAIGLLASLLLVAAVGCASNGADQSANGKAGDAAAASDDSKGSGTHGGDGRDADAGASGTGGKAAAGGAGAGARAASSDADRSMPGTTGGANHVRILEKGCVQFEPRWAEIAVGSSITWTSEAKQPVTIHFPSGVFSRSEFTVPPGGSITSGSALRSGSYPLWTNPSSCQDAPLGARGSGPGVAVKAAGNH
jgi:hypothetical protein